MYIAKQKMMSQKASLLVPLGPLGAHLSSLIKSLQLETMQIAITDDGWLIVLNSCAIRAQLEPVATKSGRGATKEFHCNANVSDQLLYGVIWPLLGLGLALGKGMPRNVLLCSAMHM